MTPAAAAAAAAAAAGPTAAGWRGTGTGPVVRDRPLSCAASKDKLIEKLII